VLYLLYLEYTRHCMLVSSEHLIVFFFKFSNESILNWLLLSTVHSITLALNTYHLHYILIPVASASLCHTQSPLPTSYQHCFYLSWFSTYWPFSLKFPPSSSHVYRLVHCLQIQSKNSPFLWCKHLWPLAISIHALLIRHNPVDFAS